MVGTWDCKDLVYAFGSLNLVNGQLSTRLLDSPARATKKTGKSKTRRLQEAFARFLRDIARTYPASRFSWVVIVIDNAPWHRGALITAVLEQCPHLEFYRLPSYCPDLNVIERVWKILRRRATHNRLFETMNALRHALRGSICYFQTYRHRLLSLIKSKRTRQQQNEKKVAAS
jgi:transposase